MADHTRPNAPDGDLEPAAKRAKLEPAIDAFLAAMQTDRGTPEHLQHAREFHRRFRELLNVYPAEDIGVFAARISRLGVPFEQALVDAVYLYGLEAGSQPASG